jgi:hypothetical protein
MTQKIKKLGDYQITLMTGLRPIPTIDNAISSLRNSGFTQKINISAEPGAVIGEHKNIEVFQNKVTIGLCQQWKVNMERLLATTNDLWYIFVEDDILCAADTMKHIVKLCSSINKQIGFISAYTPKHYLKTWPWLETYKGWAKINRGRDTWGTQFIVLQRESMELFSKAPRLDTTNHAIDSVLGEFFLHKGLDCYYAVPSLVEHVGLSNSSYNVSMPTNCGLRFGEEFRINNLLV